MTVAEITKAECAERARLLRVESYAVALDLAGGETFRSAAVIRFGCREPGSASYADLVAHAVHEVTLNGVALDPAEVCADGRITLAGLAAENELRVVADFAYTGDGSALHRSTDSADGRVYCYTNLFPADARRVFACFDQPDLKAEFAFEITAPADWVVLSNQLAPKPEPAGEGTAVWRFTPTPRISTYLAAVVAGEYHLVTDSHTTPAGQVIPLGLACRQSLASHLEADDMLAITRQGLDYYTGLFASPFPFEKHDQVMVPDFQAGAMENVACVTFAEAYIYRSKATRARYELRAETILHELAHQWFGDLVTMRWWEDLWLNESFAEFCGTQSAAEATAFTDAWTTFCAGRKVWGYLQDQQPSTHPVAGEVGTLTEAVANFDGISYAKGGAILKQLVAYLGRDVFFSGIRAYFTEHGWANASLADLLRALEASSGRSLAEWARAWLQTAGPSTLQPEFTLDEAGRFSEFAVLQEAPASHPALRPHHIAIGLYSRDAARAEDNRGEDNRGDGNRGDGNRGDDDRGDGNRGDGNRGDDDRGDGNRGDGNRALLCSKRVELDVTGARTVVPELAGHQRPDLVLLNDADLDYAVIRFDDRSLRTLTTSLGALADPLARAVCWGAVLDMALQGELSLPRFVRIVTAAMPGETLVPVMQTVLGLTGRLIRQTADPAEVAGLQQELAATALPLLRAAEPGSDWQLTWAQLLSTVASTPGQLDLLTGLREGTAEIPGLAVGTDLRWDMLLRLATVGRATEAGIDAEFERDATDAGRRCALSCRAAIPDAGHKAAAWRLLAESEELGPDGIFEVARGFGQPEHAHLLAPYAEKYFAQLPAIWAARPDMIRIQLGRLLFPYTAASPQLLRRAEEFLAAADHDRGLARAVIEGRDVAEKALRARALPAE